MVDGIVRQVKRQRQVFSKPSFLREEWSLSPEVSRGIRRHL